jgi:hypothetical protein
MRPREFGRTDRNSPAVLYCFRTASDSASRSGGAGMARTRDLQLLGYCVVLLLGFRVKRSLGYCVVSRKPIRH